MLFCSFLAGQNALPGRWVWDGMSRSLVCGQPVIVDKPALTRTSTRQADGTVMANAAHGGQLSLASGDASGDLMLSTPV